MKILVCDDERQLADEINHNIRSAVDAELTELVGNPDLTDALASFFKGIRQCLENPRECKPVAPSQFDTDIMIVDNNLTHLDVTGTRLTAEMIIGYLRAFTSAAYIISLNKRPDVDFDLEYLVGDVSTRADMALNTRHLANRALWTGNPSDATDQFIPWYWPQPESAATRRREQEKFVLDHLRDSVLTILDFDDEKIGFLSPHAKGALSPWALAGEQHEGHPIQQVTFRDVFLHNERSLAVQDERNSIAEAEEAGNTDFRELMARVVAAHLDLWFRRDVIGPQEPLVDIPHLLMRLPFLLGARANDINEWNRAITVDRPPYGLEEGLYERHLRPAEFHHSVWVPKPCFWWTQLKADEKLNEYFFSLNQGDWADVVFCEDRSQFFPRDETADNPPSEFPSDLEGSWSRRYVSLIDSIKYSPGTQLAL